ncbi:MAG: DUF2683 family protein [Nanoarchaeota archaeon]|nr:DUF2683 family protein [Nanoarchaeota archaeon]
MVTMQITLTPEINTVIEIVKARFNLKSKKEALKKIIEFYENEVIYPIKPEYIKKLKEIDKEKTISRKQLMKSLGNKK